MQNTTRYLLSIVKHAHDAHVEIELEVYGLFSDIVPADAVDGSGDIGTARH